MCPQGTQKSHSGAASRLVAYLCVHASHIALPACGNALDVPHIPLPARGKALDVPHIALPARGNALDVPHIALPAHGKALAELGLTQIVADLEQQNNEVIRLDSL